MHELLDNPKVKAWRTLMSAHTKILRFLEAELLKENCSIPRFQIFFHLYFHGPASSIELARTLCVTRGNISTFIRRLQEDLLVSIEAPEGRGGKQIIKLTKKGESFFENLLPDHIKRVISAMPDISKKSLTVLETLKIG